MIRTFESTHISPVEAPTARPARPTLDTLRVPTEGKAATVSTQNIPPGEFVELRVVWRHPRDTAEIVSPLRRRFADGGANAWTKGPNGTRFTAMTTLAPRWRGRARR